MANARRKTRGQTPAMETYRLSKIFPPGILAVNRLTLKIPQGVVHALVGPNGAGKTTTLRLIAGLSRPNRGSIFIMGYDLLRESWNAKTNLGFLPDTPAAYDTLTVDEFLIFIGSLFSVPEDDFHRRRLEYIERFEISGFLNKYLGELSRGMLQRALLTALLIRNPKVLLMDEPLYGLDPEGGYVLKRIIRELAENGNTVILSTHNLNVAEEVSDEFTILSEGVKVASGSVEELRREVGGGAALENYYIRTLKGRERL
ncbi:ABC transporter ATP-binding protein [Candidatus Bathyarchaeota archaeon]|nr:ABC transporter ATP-binding protein [Candidatus Bathyarchaeota archaeon]